MITQNRQMNPHQRFRSIWISDVHLGTRSSRADDLLDFLRHTDSDHLYVVGDLIDGLRLKRSWYWPQAHNDVIQKLLRKARKGTAVTYIPGNHDAFARNFCGVQAGGIRIAPMAEHITADNRRILVVHGDEFESVLSYARWVQALGCGFHAIALYADYALNKLRGSMGQPRIAFSSRLKSCTGRAERYYAQFRETALREAAKGLYDGVVCGHIHQPGLSSRRGISFCNTGDWQENASALVEYQDGRMGLIHWTSPLERSHAADDALTLTQRLRLPELARVSG